MLARMAQMAWASSQGAVFVSSAVECLPTGYITSSLFATGPQQNSFFTTNVDDNDQIFRAFPTKTPSITYFAHRIPPQALPYHNHPQSTDPETQPNPTSTTPPPKRPPRPPSSSRTTDRRRAARLPRHMARNVDPRQIRLELKRLRRQTAGPGHGHGAVVVGTVGPRPRLVYDAIIAAAHFL
jgi:hypothetical protein